MITVIDYGAGNLRSVANALEAIGQTLHITNEPKDLENASAIVLPGVGAFGEGMNTMRRLGLVEPLNEQILIKKKPFLGICVGMQFLAREGFEHGTHQGFGWVDGIICRIAPNEERFRVPHIGWNVLDLKRPSPLFAGLEEDPIFYFVHSYHLTLEQEVQDCITSTCWHGTEVTASIEWENIYAVQFHPEKSQRNGLKLLSNFVDLVKEW